LAGIVEDAAANDREQRHRSIVTDQLQSGGECGKEVLSGGAEAEVLQEFGLSEHVGRSVQRRAGGNAVWESFYVHRAG